MEPGRFLRRRRTADRQSSKDFHDAAKRTASASVHHERQDVFSDLVHNKHHQFPDARHARSAGGFAAAFVVVTTTGVGTVVSDA